MIWEQKTEAVIMLNRVVEKNQVSFMDNDQAEALHVYISLMTSHELYQTHQLMPQF